MKTNLTASAATILTASVISLTSMTGCDKPAEKPAEKAGTPPSAVSAPAEKPADAGSAAKTDAAPQPRVEVVPAKPEAAPGGDKAPSAKPEGDAKEPTAAEVKLPDVVADVEGEPLPKGELETALKNAVRTQGMDLSVLDKMPAAQRTQTYKMVLDGLILERLVAKRSSKVEVKDEEVEERLMQIKKGYPDEEAFKKQVEASGYTLERVVKDVRSSIQQQRWIEEQKKGGVAKVTDADAEEFYKGNPDQFKQPEMVKASHILVKLGEQTKEEDVAVKEKIAKELLDRVKGGEDFAKLALEMSEDPSAKQNKGDLDFFTKEQMVPEFSKAAFEAKSGDIVGPVKTQFGFHIIKVTDRKEASVMSLEEVKPRLISFLENRKADEFVRKMLKELREKAEVKVHLQ
jgi:peptidyl-prolyl cis-trans isomerase C